MSAIIIFVGDGRCLGDKCQITRGVSAYARTEMSCASRQINRGCMESATDSGSDRPTLGEKLSPCTGVDKGAQGPSPPMAGQKKKGRGYFYQMSNMYTCVRPWAAAVGAPGGNAGGCREFKLVLCGFATAATVATAAVWSWGAWPPECFSNQPVPASSLPDEAVW